MTKIFFCGDCAKGKSHVLPFPKTSASRSECVLDLLHMDLMGPMEVNSVGGSRYVLVVVDDCTRFCWVQFLKSKSDCFLVFKRLLQELETQKERKLKVIRSDCGGEFLSREFSSFLEDRGIRHELSIPEAKPQNGVTESMNRTLVERARTMLCASSLPKTSWAEAVAIVCYVRNRCPTRSLSNNITPYEAFFGHKPSVGHLRVFGCVAFANLLSGQRRKFDSKADLCIFLGFSLTSKGYRLWDVEHQKVIERRDVLFDEATMGLLMKQRK